jgi:Zn-dependent protease with chaperone function
MQNIMEIPSEKMRYTRFRHFLLINILLAGLFAVSLLSAQGQTDVFDRTDREKEIEVGRQMTRLVEKYLPLSTNKEDQARVQRIGQALINSLPEKAYPYQYKVLAVPDFNAFTLPGGFIYVYEGLLARLPDDNAVAFVMGHELTHAAHRHWAKHVDEMKGVTIGAILLGVASGQGDITSLVQELLSLRYSRDEEEDADKTGLHTAWEAGFDPEGAVEAARVMDELEKGHSQAEYLSDHPPAKNRLEYLETEAKELEKQPRPAHTYELPADLMSALLPGNAPGASPAKSSWCPLAVGNQWTYRVMKADVHTQYSVRIVSAIPFQGGSIYRVETTFNGSGKITSLLMTTSDAQWGKYHPDDPASIWRLSFPFQITTGQTLVQGGTVWSALPSESITTPCGLFKDTLKLHQASAGKTCDIWFAKGEGMVQRTCVETGVTEQLISCKVQSE